MKAGCIGNHPLKSLKDHLGFASVVTDATGIVVGEQRYYPYGGTRISTGTIYTDKLFTGQREMTGLGIYHYGARFYSPKVGRFLSPDTIVPGAANPQAYNRYSYVLNMPISATDPTGHKCVGEAEECLNNDGSTGGGFTGGSGNGSNNNKGCGGNGQKRCNGNAPTYGDGLIGPSEDPSELTPYVENSPWIVVNWYGLSNFTQDIATTVSAIGASAELVFIGYGCVQAGLPGCVGGVVVGNTIWVGTGLNGLEQTLGGASLVFTTIADYQDDNNIGEATHTSVATFATGLIATDPVVDLFIDGYASGYNHGFFCGIDTILNC